MRPYFLVHHDDSSLIVLDESVPVQLVNGVGPAPAFEKFTNRMVEAVVKDINAGTPGTLRFNGKASGVVEDAQGFGYHLQSYDVKHDAVDAVMHAFHQAYVTAFGDDRIGAVIDLDVDMQGWTPTQVVSKVVATLVPTLASPRY